MLKVTRSVLVVLMLSVGGLGFADPSGYGIDGGPLIEIPEELILDSHFFF